MTLHLKLKFSSESQLSNEVKAEAIACMMRHSCCWRSFSPSTEHLFVLEVPCILHGYKLEINERPSKLQKICVIRCNNKLRAWKMTLRTGQWYEIFSQRQECPSTYWGDMWLLLLSLVFAWMLNHVSLHEALDDFQTWSQSRSQYPVVYHLGGII